MLSANVRFALLFSTMAFRLVEIGEHLERISCHLLIDVSDRRLEQGQVLLVSPAFWLSSNLPEDFGMAPLETKPLPALLTAMVLAGFKHPIIHPVACDLGSLGLGSVLQRSTVRDDSRSPEMEAFPPRSGAFEEQVCQSL